MEKITFTPDRKYKMTADEVQSHLHMKRKGSCYGKDKTKYNRKQKYKNAY